MPATATPVRMSTPLSGWTAASAVPSSAPAPRISGAGAPSSTTTSAPARRAVAATSSPMNPAPMTTTRTPGSTIAARSAIASSRLRSTCTFGVSGWPGSRRGCAPVAMINPSNGTSLAVGERDRAGVEVEARGRHAESGVEAERVERVVLAQGDAVGVPRAGEELLRQRGPVVGAVSFGPDQRDRSAEPGRAQRLARPQPGERAADDDDPDHARTGRAIECVTAPTMPYDGAMSAGGRPLWSQHGDADDRRRHRTGAVDPAAVNALVRESFPGSRIECTVVEPDERDRAVAADRRRPASRRVHLGADPVRGGRRRAVVPGVRRARDGWS